MNHVKIPVYLIPGMAASSRIFEFISLPEEDFELHALDWIPPVPDESLETYASRLSAGMTKENPVLIGVSFGGIIVQEIAAIRSVRKVIIISSVKTRMELPKRMQVSKTIRLHKLLPTSWVRYINTLDSIRIPLPAKSRLKLYSRYMYLPDPGYIDWAIDRIVCWERKEALPGILHIHGDRDPVFPIARIQNCLVVKGGTHTMIIHRYKWFNSHLPELILQ